MADNTQALMALDNAAQGAIAPYTTPVDLTPYKSPVLMLLQKAQSTMPFVPQNLVSVAQQVFALGAFPRLRAFYAGAARPSWLTSDNSYQAWQTFIKSYLPIENSFISGNNLLLAQQASDLQNNVDFWNTVSKYSGEDYLEKVWADFWVAVDNLRANRDSAKLALSTANDILSQYGSKVPATYSAQTNALSAQFNDLTSQAVNTLSVIPGGATYAGLGVAALVIAGIAAATVVAITASIWAIAHEFSAVQINAGNNAKALMTWRDQQDQADYEAGKITNSELVARRSDTVAAGTAIVNAQGAAALGKAVGQAGSGFGIGLGLTLGSMAVLGIGGWLLFRHFRKSP